jgi:hypothetical protein
MGTVAKQERIHKASTANPEFLFVLSKVVMALEQAMHHEKLADLTPEQMADWFKSIEPEHISCVIQALEQGTREHEMLMKAWGKIAERAPCDGNGAHPSSGRVSEDREGKPN